MRWELGVSTGNGLIPRCRRVLLRVPQQHRLRAKGSWAMAGSIAANQMLPSRSASGVKLIGFPAPLQIGPWWLRGPRSARRP